ncbi:MAG: hypothetical protein KH183_02015, partial [Clostridium sp.]|nr:hypothetical protein [Clostridium sp.]
VLFYLWFCRPTFILAQEFILISKDLSSPCIAGGVIFTVTQKRLEINGTLSLDFQPGAFLSARTDTV